MTILTGLIYFACIFFVCVVMVECVPRYKKYFENPTIQTNINQV